MYVGRKVLQERRMVVSMVALREFCGDNEITVDCLDQPCSSVSISKEVDIACRNVEAKRNSW